MIASCLRWDVSIDCAIRGVLGPSKSFASEIIYAECADQQLFDAIFDCATWYLFTLTKRSILSFTMSSADLSSATDDRVFRLQSQRVQTNTVWKRGTTPIFASFIQEQRTQHASGFGRSSSSQVSCMFRPPHDALHRMGPHTRMLVDGDIVVVGTFKKRKIACFIDWLPHLTLSTDHGKRTATEKQNKALASSCGGFTARIDIEKV